jgi:hypothetical protein
MVEELKGEKRAGMVDAWLEGDYIEALVVF